MKSDALTVEGTSGVASILRAAGLHDYAEVPDDVIVKLCGSLAAPPEPIAAKAPVEPPKPECQIDGLAQLAMHRELKRRRENDRRAQQRALKAKFQQAA